MTEARATKFVEKYHTGATDKMVAERLVAAVYGSMAQTSPFIIWMPSPMAANIAFLYMHTLFSMYDIKGRKIVKARISQSPDFDQFEETFSNLSERLSDIGQTWLEPENFDSIASALNDLGAQPINKSLIPLVAKELRKQLPPQIKARFPKDYAGILCDALESDIRFETDTGTLSFLHLYSTTDFGHLDLHFRDKRTLDASENELRALGLLLQEVSMVAFGHGIAFLVEKPVFKFDPEKRLHSEKDFAIKYRDGTGATAFRGVGVPSEWILNPKSLTPKIALKYPNIEQRRAACEILGWNNILKLLDSNVIDDSGDPSIGQLIEVDIPDVGWQLFLRVKCGTGRDFALPVPDDMETALEAQAWTWGLTPEQFKKPEVRT